MSENQMCGANVAGESMLVFEETDESGISTSPRAAFTGVDFRPHRMATSWTRRSLNCECRVPV